VYGSLTIPAINPHTHDASGIPCTRLQYVLEADAPQHFGADPIADTMNHLRTILRRIYVYPVWPLPKRCVHHAHNGLSNRCRVSVWRFQRRKSSVAQSDMILTIPSRMVHTLEKSAGVRVVKAPRELVGFKYEMSWHARLTADPAHEWFRDQVRAVAKDLH
jgi:DNA-binding transcriptional LysR family regulator